jgi:hypothetical protein
MHKMLLIVALFALVSCSPAAITTTKDTARTVNDAARIACEVAFGAEELPQGLTIEDLCEAQEDLQPFIDAILGAKQTVGTKHGVAAEE